MAATQPAVHVRTSTPVNEKSDINPSTEKTSKVTGTVPVTSTDSIEKTYSTTIQPRDTEESEAAGGGVCRNIDQCSLLQQVQLTRAPVIDQKKPTQLSAKRRLSYAEHLHEIPTSKLCSHRNNVTESKETNNDSSHQIQRDVHECDTVASNGSCSGTESVSTGNQMQSPSDFTPCEVLTSLNSLKAVSPLTKAFKSTLAFHMQASQPSLELQHPSHALSTATASPPVMIPSFSVPCLLSPHIHSVPQTFILDMPPLDSRISKSPSLVSCQTSLGGTNVGSSVERNGEVPRYASTRVFMSQPSSPGVGTTIGYSNVVYAAPTTGKTNCSQSMISDVTSPIPAGYSKSGCGKSSDNVTLESMLRGHGRRADGLSSRGPSVNIRSQPPHSSGGQLKRALLQSSPLQPGMQQQTQSSFRCPRLIQCSNCGHRIDLKTYIGHSQQKTEVMPPAHRSVPTKSNVSNTGLTVFDLEVICDTGRIDQTSSTPSPGKQQAKRGSITMKSSSHFDKPQYHCNGTTKPCFPHSDELTRSFAPILSDYVGECVEDSTLPEGWGKLDTLDVDEMLQLLETAPEIRYSSSRIEIADSKVYYGKPQKNNGAMLESVKPANHIVNEDYDPCYTCKLHSSSGKTSHSGNFTRKAIGKLTRYHEPTTDCNNDSEKSESSNSDGEIVPREEEPDRGRIVRSRAKQPSSRICKRRQRKKQIKKAIRNKKKDKQKIAA